MVKIKSLIKKLDRLNIKYTLSSNRLEARLNNKLLCAIFNFTDKPEDAEPFGIKIETDGNRSDSMTDYSGGVWRYTIKSAIESLTCE